jgi:hypothetical protein
MPDDPHRVCAAPSISVTYMIGMLESDANSVYFVAAAPSPIASRTTAENPA